MNHVVMFSGGIASWATAKRVAAEHGTSNLTLLFTDTNTEDEDLYRFISQAAVNVGGGFVRLADGRNIWQIFKDERFLGNTRADPCSRILKRQLARKWIEDRFTPSEVVLYLGLDWTEVHRLGRSQKAWLPYEVRAPLVNPPYRLRSELMAELEASGIEVPRLYQMGFEHNNCGGGCVKAGQGHFAQLLQVFPARYAEWERNEEEVRVHIGKNVAILRDRTGGESKPLTLRDLRLRLEAGEEPLKYDIGGCACFEEPEADEEFL